ncbi:FUSC family protein [Antrihabitans cavernicola]|uniref:FUSC family protein n=2 Tax=Antrihabitans cavernicola TaxID=2495913 RepID=A0A5A7S8A1_9NOCA|nr:FUSC family protein [Spelaeibacter cavernicola]
MFVGLPPVGRRWSAGLRSAFAFGIPALIAVTIGHNQQALVVTLGAFAVIYGEGRPYRTRWSTVCIAGAALFGAAAVGTVVGKAGGSQVVEVLVLAVVAMIGAYVVAAARLGPPGSFFFVLVCAVAVLMAKGGLSPAVILSCTAIGVASAVVVSMAGVVVDRRKPERMAVAAAQRSVAAYLQQRESGAPAGNARHDAGAAVHAAWTAVYDAGLPERTPNSALPQTLLDAHMRFVGIAVADPDTANDRQAPQPRPQIPLARPSLAYRLHRSLSFQSQAATTAMRVAVASLVSGGVSIAFGLPRPDWAIIAAVLVLHQGPDRIRGSVRGLHRFVGTAVGLVFFGVLFQLSLTGVWLILVLMALQFLIELFIARNYGIAVVFITPVALLIGGGSNPNIDIATVMRDRLIETTVGVAVGVAALWLVVPHAHRRTFGWTAARTLDAGQGLIELVRRERTDTLAALRLRRDLQFELTGCARSGVDSAYNERSWTERNWSAHAAVGQLGYDLLGACWSAPDGTLADPNSWSEDFRRAREERNTLRR